LTTQFAGTGRPPGKGDHVAAKSSLNIKRTLEAGEPHNGPELSFTRAKSRPGSPGATSSVSTSQTCVAGASGDPLGWLADGVFVDTGVVMDLPGVGAAAVAAGGAVGGTLVAGCAAVAGAVVGARVASGGSGVAAAGDATAAGDAAAAVGGRAAAGSSPPLQAAPNNRIRPRHARCLTDMKLLLTSTILKHTCRCRNPRRRIARRSPRCKCPVHAKRLRRCCR